MSFGYTTIDGERVEVHVAARSDERGVPCEVD